MPKYDVHIYAIARLKVASVAANSPQDAGRNAEQMVDLHHAIASREAEYADEVEGFLVDVLDEAGRRIEGQSLYFDAKKRRFSATFGDGGISTQDVGVGKMTVFRSGLIEGRGSDERISSIGGVDGRVEFARV